MGSAASSVRARRRFYKYGSDYFDHVILPNCRELIDELEMSHSDARMLLQKFVAMDADGSGNVSISEFHRYFGWKRGAFTERIFNTYSALTTKSSHQPQNIQNHDELSYEELLVCVWNYASYDARLMAQFVFNIFDIDGVQSLSMDECDAMLRMVHHNQDTHSCDDAMKILGHACKGSSITLESFRDLVDANNAVIQPAFDIQLRIIETTTGDIKNTDGKGCWEIYRERRREKFGDAEIPEIQYKDTSLASALYLSRVEDNCQEKLSNDVVSEIFRRVERHINAPPGFDSRLEEERYVDKLRELLDQVETTLSLEDFCIERVEERKDLRKKLWALIDKIKVAHVDALLAELERDEGIWERGNADGILEYSSVEEMQDYFDQLITLFHDSWDSFTDSYVVRFGPVTTKWERLYDPDQQMSVYFQWQTGERCYDLQVGNQPPAICEVCDHLLALSDYKCFNCDTPRSERNRKKAGMFLRRH